MTAGASIANSIQCFFTVFQKGTLYFFLSAASFIKSPFLSVQGHAQFAQLLPNMQNVINFTFDSYIAGQSTGFIAKELNNRGLMYGNTSWRGSYVAKLIRDERLIGKHIRYSKQIKGVKRVVIETIPRRS